MCLRRGPCECCPRVWMIRARNSAHEHVTPGRMSRVDLRVQPAGVHKPMWVLPAGVGSWMRTLGPVSVS